MTLATAPRRSTAPSADRGARPRRDLGAWFLVLPALLPILVLSVGPLLYGIGLAFTDAQSGRTQATRFVGLLNFSDLFQDSLFWDSFRIGLIWALGVTVPQFLLALGLALLLHLDLRLRWLYPRAGDHPVGDARGRRRHHVAAGLPPGQPAS